MSAVHDWHRAKQTRGDGSVGVDESLFILLLSLQEVEPGPAEDRNKVDRTGRAGRNGSPCRFRLVSKTLEAVQWWDQRINCLPCHRGAEVTVKRGMRGP